MRRFADTVLRYRAIVVLVWLMLVGAAAVFAVRLDDVLQGGAEPIPGSPSDEVNQLIQARFGPGSLYQYLVVLESSEASIYQADFRLAAQRVADALTAINELREVRTPWNFPLPDLMGQNYTSTLLLVTPDVATHHEAERLTRELREAIASAALPPSFSAHVTSMSAMFYDLDVNSNSDLLHA